PGSHSLTAVYGGDGNFTGQTSAALSQVVQWIVSASAGPNGAISPSGSVGVNDASARAFTITPNAHYHVTDVLVDGASVGAVTSYSFAAVAANHTIAASFAIDTYTLSASAGSNGSIAPNGTTTLNYGASQTFTITPDAHYHVANVLVDGASAG